MRIFTFMISLLFLTAFYGTSEANEIRNNQPYKSTISYNANTPIKIEINLTEDLAWRAENLPKKASDRGPSPLRTRNRGFTHNGYYGTNELEKLQRILKKRVSKSLDKAGINVSDEAQATLKLTLVDVAPSRPTLSQRAKDTRLSFNSISLGGAKILAVMVDANGNEIGEASYAYYEQDIEEALTNSIWSDTRIAFNNFARHLSGSVKETT